MKKYLIIFISAFLALITFSCQPPNTQGEDADNPVADSIKSIVQPVKVLPIEYTTIKRTAKVTATMMGEQETYLATAIPGKIRKIKVDVNDRVKKGQTLVEMDMSQLSQTRIQYADLKKNLARMDTLIQYGSITQQAYDQMKTQVNATWIALSNLEENTVLRAPYSGVITGKYFNDGEMFSGAPNTQVGKAAIVSLVKMDVLKLLVNLSEGYLPLVKEGQIAKVLTDVYPNDTLEAKVYRIYPTINQATRTFTVELRMDNPEEKIRPGMFATVTLEMGDREALLVPALSVLKQSGTNNRYIFVQEDSLAVKKMVTLGERLDDKLELISNGVKAGEMIIYAGHVNLMDGEKIKVVQD